MDGDPAAVEPPRTSRERRRAFLHVLRGLALPCAALLGLTWWWRHPDVFLPDAMSIGVRDRPGTTALVGMTSGSSGDGPRSVRLHSARPRTGSLPVGVTVDVQVCSIRSADDPVVSDRGSLAARCARVQRVEGAVLDLTDETVDQLVLVVRSTGPHRITVEALDVSYTAGWQRGHQVVGPTVVADFTGEGQEDYIGIS
jgi:hypothetical protein